MRRIAITAACLTSGLLAFAFLNRMSAQQNDSAASPNDESRIRRGLQIAPVRLNLEGRNRALVGLGSYLVNAVASCNDCHSCPSYAGNPYQGGTGAINVAGYLAGGVPFGPFTSRNLTPQPGEDNRPAGLTLSQFREVMRTGIDLDHLHPQISLLLQVMPWPVLRFMNDRDLAAIYEYLGAIPHAETPPPGACTGAGQ